MKIFQQILREFIVPLVLSILWVIYNIHGDSKTDWDIQSTVNVFGPTFFLLSWLTGQFFRVKKQSKVEDSFAVMESKLKELLAKVESKTDEMINHTTGGNSFPYIQIGMIDDISNNGHLVAIHEGNYPLYDVTARIVDLQKFGRLNNNYSLNSLSYTETNIIVGNMHTSHASFLRPWKIDHEPEQSYNIFLNARNDSFIQNLRLKKVNGKWESALKVKNSKGEIIHEQIDENFPKEPDGGINWG